MGDIPPAIGDKLWPLSRFLGYRPEEVEKDKGTRKGNMLPESVHDMPKYQKTSSALAQVRNNTIVQELANVCLTFLGSFFGAALIATMSRSPPFRDRSVPIVVGSFGAEAVLLYAAHKSPLAQPRNVIGGNVISAIIGVALGKGFTKLPNFQVGQIGDANWAAAALSISIALAAMQLLEVTHPPGGATALLAVTLPNVYSLGWFYVGDIAAASCIMLVWAMFINNIGNRRYPTYWIAEPVKKKVQGKNGT